VSSRRHPGDFVRLVVALALLALTTLVARSGNISASEADAFRLFNDLPRIFTGIALPLLVLGSPVAIGAAALSSSSLKRCRADGDRACCQLRLPPG